MSSQSIIWSFITEYRRVTGNKLTYLELIQNRELTQKVLDHADQSRDLRLKKVATAFKDTINSGNFSFVQKKANKTLQNRPEAKTETTKKKITGTPLERQYMTLLQRMLDTSEITILERETLDTFCRRRSLDISKALGIEQVMRSEQNIPALNWQHEILSSVRRFIRLHGTLTETDRLLLTNTYLRKDRISAPDLEKIIERELASNRPQKVSPQPSSKKRWLTAFATCTVFLVGAWFFFSATSTKNYAQNQQPEYPAEITVSGSITEDTTWHARTRYRLQGPVFIEGTARLTIEPGTTIMGEFGSALIVTRDARIYARGQKNTPIIFTSAKAKGARQRGDWGGVVLLGNASINRSKGHIEGVDPKDSRGRFGGQLDNDSCGVLEYTRIEFAGFEVFADNELNGLTLGGCGSNTIVRHVQVHRAADDGIEMFGGTADLKYVLITGAKDDSLDWDMGWRGRVQFMVVQQYNDAGDNGFEADNWSKAHDAEPRSNPHMYNVTLIGSDNPNTGQRAMNLRRGTAGTFHNFIVMGHSKEFVDIRDEATAALATQGELTFSNSLIYKIGKNGKGYFSEEKGKQNDDNGFDEKAFFKTQNNLQFGIDPLLTQAQQIQEPSFIPPTTSPASKVFENVPQGEFWDESVTYVGAIRPGTSPEAAWWYSWSAFPAN